MKIDNNDNNISQTNFDFDDFNINVFGFGNLYQEYNFDTRETKLYIQYSDDEQELLYDKEIDENNKDNYISNIYTKDSVYILCTDNSDNIISLYHLPKSIYLLLMNLPEKEQLDESIDDKAYQNYADFLYSHSTTLIEEKRYCSDSFNFQNLLDEFKPLFVKYRCATTLIPFYIIVDKFISDIHTYISNKDFNNSSFERRFTELQNFKDFGPNTIAELSSFIKNPKSTNLRVLCDSLQNSLSNTSKLINLYLGDELNLQEKGEK